MNDQTRTSLYTPYLFTPGVVRREVKPRRAGAYILGNDQDGFVAGYVGRSDTDLQGRLLGHNHLFRFDYFIFRYAADQAEAFHLECQLWHDCRDRTLHNIYHPAAPKGSGLTCRYCDFASGIAKSHSVWTLKDSETGL